MTFTTGKKRVRSQESGVTKKGFTLMEMLVVLAVIVLLIGVSIPFFASFTKGAKLKTAAKDVVAVLNTARIASITYRKNYSVNFDYSQTPHSYYITDENNEIYGKKYHLPSSIKFSRPQQPQQPTTFTADKATFSSTGGLIGSVGSVWLADKKEDFRRITVSNTTGRVKIDQEP
ncbi:MAG: prepilin-type N-terminal cleavage/methylation domain-containing protein [Omnitrophica bacterium]|nr:prepilin-type N-terminal cleavage/methylation domain-containing protein [Candidatus Omnitrophota bacterium]